MKLLIQIPCLNEEATLPATLQDIPREIAGIDQVEILVIDDGCTDRTVDIARSAGVEHIVSFTGNRGLGYAFAAGFDYCLNAGADIIVNTDGDNQYCGADIPKLIAPILEHRADIVIGDRQCSKVAHFSWLKRNLQALGSRVVSFLAGIEVPDVASGFRAYSRRKIVTKVVPIRTNEKLRESRLFSSIWTFISRSIGIMVRVYASYRALVIFTFAGLVSLSLGALLGLRFLYFFFFVAAESDSHVQSLILAAVLLIAGFQMILTGILADLMNSTRSILEDTNYRIRKLESGDHARKFPSG